MVKVDRWTPADAEIVPGGAVPDVVVFAAEAALAAGAPAADRPGVGPEAAARCRVEIAVGPDGAAPPGAAPIAFPGDAVAALAGGDGVAGGLACAVSHQPACVAVAVIGGEGEGVQRVDGEVRLVDATDAEIIPFAAVPDVVVFAAEAPAPAGLPADRAPPVGLEAPARSCIDIAGRVDGARPGGASPRPFGGDSVAALAGRDRIAHRMGVVTRDQPAGVAVPRIGGKGQAEQVVPLDAGQVDAAHPEVVPFFIVPGIVVFAA